MTACHAACCPLSSVLSHPSSKPRAKLRRARCERHRHIRHRRDHLRVSHTRCALLCRLPPRVAVSQKKATQQPSGVNACGIQHNRALFAAAPVVRYALLVGRPRITGGYVLRPCRLPHARLRPAFSTDSQCARAGKSNRHQHMRLVRRCAPVWWCTRPRAARAGTPVHRYVTTVKSSRRCPLRVAPCSPRQG